ncbi:DUF2807 domain-containing protein [Henriciella sp. AS95]|uniref:GIN domain-containing protein n=1 Tax=Henriciella sp. AS95 TaxID=3135782 RepID=UPI00317B434B
MSKLIAPLAIVSAVALAAPAFAETQSYDVRNFDGIDVSAGIEVIFETGVSRYVTVENDKGDFSDIIVEVDDGDLILKRPRKMGWGKKRTPYTVRVGVESLSDIEASSGSSVEGGGMSGDVDIDVSSGADVIVAGISAGEVDLESSSGSTVEVAGSCTTVEAEASSGASIDASNLQCTALVADVSSGASIRAYATDRVDADASSGGSVRVGGGATNVTIDKSSGGSVSVS